MGFSYLPCGVGVAATPQGGSGTYLVLLQVGFTYLPQSLRVLVSPYLAFSPLPCGVAATPTPQGGMFSVALSLPP